MAVRPISTFIPLESGPAVAGLPLRALIGQWFGVHPYRVGETHEFWLDVRHGLYFAPDGRRVA